MIKEVDGKSFSTIYQYNSLQQLLSVTEANGNQTAYSYDMFGNLVKVLYPDGSFVTKKYDENHRLIEEVDGNGDKVRYYYDQNSNLIKKIDKAGNIFTYEYNTRDLLTKVSSGNDVISYTYDAAGNRTQMVDSTGTTNYTYTPTDQLQSVTYPDGKTITYTYDAAERRTQLVDPFGKSIFYQYDEVNQLKSVHLGTANATAEAAYQYDNRGLVTKKTLKNGTTSDYTYDEHNQLNSLFIRSKITSPTNYSYQYDKNGNLITQNINQVLSNYSYDNVDRIISERPLEKEYVYDQKNNRTSLDVDSLEALIGADYSYQYDIWGRLASVTLENGQVITYRYNGDGLLYEREFNGERTRYYYDGGQLIAEATVTTNGPRLKARYTRGKDFTELLSVELANGTKGYYVQERHGDIIRIEGETGNVLNEYTYDIWGNPIVQNETIESPFRYAGEWVDEKTNLQYLRARWYDAKLGRFISEDPVEGIFTEPLSLNRYTYVDPSGNIVGTLIDAGFLIYDAYQFIKEPSKANAGNVGLSFASTLIPGVTGGSAAVKAVTKGSVKPVSNMNEFFDMEFGKSISNSL